MISWLCISIFVNMNISNLLCQTYCMLLKQFNCSPRRTQIRCNNFFWYNFRYLSDNFPKVLDLYDVNKRTALHYSGIVQNENFHKVLQQAGASSDLKDKVYSKSIDLQVDLSQNVRLRWNLYEITFIQASLKLVKFQIMQETEFQIWEV